MMIRHSTRWAAALVIFGFLAFHLSVLGHYGKSFDEDSSFLRGSNACWMFENVFSGSPASPDQTLTNLALLRHPTSFAILNFQVRSAALVFGIPEIEAGHILLVLWAGLGLIFLYALVEPFFGGMTALFSVIFLGLYPFFFGNAQINPKDIPVTVCCIGSVLLFIRWLRKATAGRAAMAGLWFGFSVGAGLHVLFLLPALAVGFLSQTKLTGRLTSPTLWRTAVVWLVGAAAALYAGWPLLWQTPANIIESLAFFSSSFQGFLTPYLGEPMLVNDLPWHYIPVNLLLATPLVTLAFAVAGFVRVATRPWSEDHRWFLIVLALWAALPILTRLYPSVVRYDRIRHIMMTFPPLAIIAAVGLNWLIETVSMRFNWRKITVGLTAATLVAALLVRENALAHPFESAYVNEAVRITVKSDMQRFVEMNAWGTPARNAMEWLNDNARPGASVCFKYPNLVASIKRTDLRFDCGQPDYIFEPPYDAINVARMKNKRLVYSLERMNGVLFNIYEERPQRDSNP